MALINGELDITVPDISVELISNFISETEKLHVALGHSKEEDTYFQRNGRPYPWNRRILQFKDKKFYNYDQRIEFEQIVKIFDQLPISQEERIVLLLQQNQQPNYDFNYHFDNDNPFGFRVCIGLDVNKVFLEQAKVKDEFHQHALNLGKIEDYMVEDKTYQIVPKRSNTVFILNANRFPHRVPIVENTARAVFVVRGKLDSIDNLNFLNKEEE